MARFVAPTRWRLLPAMAALGLSANLAVAATSGNGTPSYQNLLQARANISAAQGLVQQLLGRIYGGGGGGGGGREPCPRGPGRGRGELGWADDGDDLENDQLAGFALQGLGASLNVLGQDIDAVTANYGQPQFPFLLAQACGMTLRLLPQAIAGRVSAAIPNEVLIHGADFDPIIQEVVAAKSQLGCF